jgi:hypothetical protein
MAGLSPDYPKNEKEFLEFIEEIDNDLKRKNILIFQRPIHAIREACLRLKVSLSVTPHGPSIPGVYQGDSLVAHMDEWYKKKYADRLKIDFSPGSVAVLIKGDVWRIDFPLMYGSFRFVFDPDLEKYKRSDEMIINGPPYVNPLRTVKGFTTELAKTLTRREMNELKEFYIFGFDAIQRLREIESKPLISEARADLVAAVNNMFLMHPHYGQSKWASLQFSEKMLKCFLKTKKTGFPRSHELSELSKLCSCNGLPVIPNCITDAIQCPAGVRYGESNVSLDEAVDAHYASLIICSSVAHEIKSNMAKESQLLKSDSGRNLEIREENFYVDSELGFFYYREKIEDDIIYWILLESYQHGRFIQVEFTQLVKEPTDFTPVSKSKDLIRLIMILNNYNRVRKK